MSHSARPATDRPTRLPAASAAGPTPAARPILNYSAGWHTFGAEWTPTNISWYVDGALYETRDAANSPPGFFIAQQPMYMILNSAVSWDYPTGAGSGGYLAFLGRISPEKRPDRANEIAIRAGMPIKIAAKCDPVDRS